MICIISVVMIFNLTSCTQRKPISIPSKSKQEENKPPKELDTLNKAVEKMETTLLEMHERSKKPLFIQQSEIQKQNEKNKKKEEQQSESSSSSSESSGQQSQKSSQIELVSPEEKLLEAKYEIQQMQLQVERANMEQFEQIKKDVLELHNMWNAFESKAENQSLMQASIKEFETALNDLTKSIQSSNVYQSLVDVTQLYKYLPDFYSTYVSDSPPEIGKIRYGAKKIVLLTEKSNFTGAKVTLDYITEIWMLTKPKLPKDSLDLINKFEFSISDLKDAIAAKNPVVIKAKSEVILKVADEIEKDSKKKAEQK